MVSKIELKGMKFYAFHGVEEQEQCVGNYFTVDVVITAPLEKAIREDSLQDTINYAIVYSLIKEEMEIPSRLIEHAAGRILSALKKAFPQIEAVEVKLTKLTPPFGGDLEGASVILSD